MHNGHHRPAPEDSRQLPSNVDAERFVLGAILCDPAAFEATAGALGVADFSIEKHRRIFQAMRDLGERGEKIDRVTLANELVQRDQLRSVDGLSYLVSLDDGLPQIHHLESYVAIVKKKAQYRRLIYTMDEIQDRCSLEAAPPSEILAGATDVIGRLFDEANTGPEKAIRRIADLPRISELDFGSVQYLIDPELPESAIVALTGSPESGKSTLATAWARDLARAGRPTLILDRDNPASVYRDRFSRLFVPDDAPIHVWGGWNAQDAPQPDSPRVLDFVRASNPKPLVVVDSLSGFYAGDENNASEMRAFMSRLRRVSNLGATSLIVHHDGKADTSKDYRGSSDFRAAIDVGFHVTNVSPNRLLDRLYLRPFKSRFGLTESIVYRYADGQFRRDDDVHAVGQAERATLNAILSENPGITGEAFERLAMGRGMKREQARTYLRIGVEFGELLSEKGPRHSTLYTLKKSSADWNSKTTSPGGLADYGGLEQ